MHRNATAFMCRWRNWRPSKVGRKRCVRAASSASRCPLLWKHILSACAPWLQVLNGTLFAASTGRIDDRWRAFMQFQIARARQASLPWYLALESSLLCLLALALPVLKYFEALPIPFMAAALPIRRRLQRQRKA